MERHNETFRLTERFSSLLAETEDYIKACQRQLDPVEHIDKLFVDLQTIPVQATKACNEFEAELAREGSTIQQAKKEAAIERAELENLRRTVADTQLILDGLSTQVASSQNEHDKLQRGCADLRTEATRIQANINAIQTSVVAITAAKVRIEDESRLAVSQRDLAQQQRDALMQEVNDKQQQSDDMTRQWDSVSSQVSRLQQQEKVLNDKLQKSQESLQELQLRENTLDDKEARLRNLRRDTRVGIEAMQWSQTTLSGMFSQMCQEDRSRFLFEADAADPPMVHNYVTTIVEVIPDLLAGLRQTKQQRDELQGSLEASRQRLRQVEDASAQSLSELNSVQNRLQNATQANSQLEQRAITAETTVKELQGKLETTRKSSIDLSNKVSSTQTEVERLRYVEGERAALSTELQEKAARIQELEQDITSDQQRATRQIEELQKQNESEAKRHDSKVVDLEGELEKKVQELATMRDELKSYQDTTEKTMQQLRDEISNEESRADQLQESAQICEEDRDNIRKAFGEHQALCNLRTPQHEVVALEESLKMEKIRSSTMLECMAAFGKGFEKTLDAREASNARPQGSRIQETQAPSLAEPFTLRDPSSVLSVDTANKPRKRPATDDSVSESRPKQKGFLSRVSYDPAEWTSYRPLDDI